MIRTKLAKKVLTKKEQKHLTESGIGSMDAMKRQVAHMQKLVAQDKEAGREGVSFPCWDCKFIARKLNLWTEEAV